MSNANEGSEPGLHPVARWWAVVGTACCFFLLTSPGRMGSADAYTQLQAAILLVQTGWVATDDSRLFDYCSVPAPDGRYYQAHDPGNIVLFVPAATVAVLTGAADPAHNVPLLGRLAASLTYAFVGAACVATVYRALCHVVSPRASLVVAVLVGCGTPLGIYARCTMDVLPAALGVSLTLWVVLAHADRRVASGRAAVWAALAVAATAWFRASLLPFIAGPALVSLYLNGQSGRGRAAVLFCAVLAAGFAPVLIYNSVRTGNPFVLGTMHPQYSEQNGFAGHFGTGLYGLLVSPNHGLFVFAPWLTLALTCAGLRAVLPRSRVVIVSFLVGAVANIVLIASLRQWAKVEWGPRYLIPVLPILALPAALAAHRLWDTRWRAVVIGLATLSLAVTVPAGVVNYSYVVTDYPGAADPLAAAPRQILGSYHALGQGLLGGELDGPEAVRSDPERAAGLRFPDLWIARLWERGGGVRFAGLVVGVFLLAGLGTGVRSLIRQGWAVGGERPAR